jgi:hypothetical protein
MSGDHNQHQKPTGKGSLQVEAEQDVDWEAVAADQAMTIAMMKAEKQEPVAYMDDKGYICKYTTNPERWIPLYTAPPPQERIVFPTSIRKMWSATDVQLWLDANVNGEGYD